MSRVPPPPPNYDWIEFKVYGKTHDELQDKAGAQLAKLLGVRTKNAHFDLDIRPLLETWSGEIPLWVATVTARVRV